MSRCGKTDLIKNKKVELLRNQIKALDISIGKYNINSSKNNLLRIKEDIKELDRIIEE